MVKPRTLECGLGPCKPRFMRPFASINWFSVCYCATSLLTSSLSIYIVSQVTTIERQFGLSSTKTGYLMACNDIGYSLSILVMSYFASRVHIPKFLCYSTVLYGVSGILCSIPHFIAPKPDIQAASPATVNMSFSSLQLCKDRAQFEAMQSHLNVSRYQRAETGREDARVHDTAMTLIALGMILQGIGKAPRFPMLAQFMDDNTGPRETGFYMGIISGVGIIGPALAYGLGGLFSQIYVTLEDVDIQPRDPRWIGAWWLGFLSFGIASIVVAFPLLCFPAHFKPSLRQLGHRTNPRKRKITCGDVCREVTGVIKSIIKVLRVPGFTLVLVATLCNVMGFSATMSFGPKFMQVQFNVPAWQANIILAVVGLGSVCIGSFFGGFLTKKINLNPPRCLLLMLSAQLPSLALNFVAMFLKCDQPVIRNWPAQHSGLPSPACSQGCFCDSDKYFPICGANGDNYFSPCSAGCAAGALQMYTNCSCIPGGVARAGLCEFDCNSLWPFNAVSFVSSLISACMMMPTLIMFLRIVPEEVKSMSVGVSALCMSLFAWLPGPVIGGKLVDAACLLWSGQAEARGYCSLYDLDTLRFNLFGYIISFRVLSSILLLVTLRLCWRMSKWPGSRDEPEVELPNNTGKNPRQIPEADSLMEKTILRS